MSETTEFSITDYDESSDAFVVRDAQGERAIPAYLIPCITGQFGEPAEIVGSRWAIPTGRSFAYRCD